MHARGGGAGEFDRMNIGDGESALSDIIEDDFVEATVFDDGATHFYRQVFIGERNGYLSFLTRQCYLDNATGGFVFNVQGNEECSRATQVEIIMQGLVGVLPEGGFLREVKEFTFFFF